MQTAFGFSVGRVLGLNNPPAGIFLQMYSHTTSILYLSCALIGMTGAPSAMVPWMNLQIASYWFAAAFSCTRGPQTQQLVW